MTTSKPILCAIWKAVSSIDQAGEDKISLDYQETECRKLAAERGYTVVDVLSVDGFSRSEGDLITALEELRGQGVTAYDRIREHWQNHTIDVLVAYTDSRLGRSPSLYTHVFDNLLSNHINIDTVQGGLINFRDRRVRNALGIIAITADLDRLHDQYDPGMTKRMEDGRPVASNDTFTHVKVRNSKGESHTYAVREENRAACDLIARSMIDRKGYHVIAGLLADYGIRGTRGSYMWDSDVRMVVLSPISWGNIARKYKNKQGIWVFDDSVDLPPGVVIQRGTHESIWTGDLGDALKEELRRRELLNTGKAWPSKLTAFSGLLVCGYCGYRMSFQHVPKPTYVWRAYTCSSNFTQINRLHGRSCESVKKSIRFEAVVEWLTPRLELAVRAEDINVLFNVNTVAPIEADLSLLKKQLIEKQAYGQRLMEDRGNTPASMSSGLQALIDRTGEELKHLEEDIARLSHKRSVQKRATVSNQRALDSLREIGTDNLWKLSEPEINQRLYAIFGNHKLSVRDGEITDFVIADGG